MTKIGSFSSTMKKRQKVGERDDGFSNELLIFHYRDQSNRIRYGALKGFSLYKVTLIDDTKKEVRLNKKKVDKHSIKRDFFWGGIYHFRNSREKINEPASSPTNGSSSSIERGTFFFFLKPKQPVNVTFLLLYIHLLFLLLLVILLRQS